MPYKTTTKTKKIMKEQLFKIKERFHCEPIMQKEIVLKQKIAEPDLYLEEVLLLSKSFFSPPWVISKTLVVARESELISKEKNVIPELIDRANDSPVCDDEDEGFEILCFFENYAVVPEKYSDQHHDAKNYIIAYSQSGFTFEFIDDKCRIKEIIDKEPENLFSLRVIAKDVTKS